MIIEEDRSNNTTRISRNLNLNEESVLFKRLMAHFPNNDQLEKDLFHNEAVGQYFKKSIPFEETEESSDDDFDSMPRRMAIVNPASRKKKDYNSMHANAMNTILEEAEDEHIGLMSSRDNYEMAVVGPR